MNPQTPKRRLTKNKILSKNGISSHFDERARNDALQKSSNYILYLSSILRQTQTYHLWSRYLAVFRKFRLVSLLIRLYSYLLLLLQFGTAFFFIAIALVLLIPVAIVSAGCVLFSALLFYGRKNRYMEHKLKDKKVYVFFPTRDGEFQNGRFWKANIAELSNKQDHTSAVLVVSPFFWSFKGIFDTSPYFLIREERKNIYLIRKHYYFSLRKKVLSKNEQLLTLIY